PHLGNYTFTDAGEINLLDFGCVRKFTGTFVQGVLDLYHALQRQDEEAAVAAYEAWGFQGLTKEKIEVLNLWAGLLYEPIMDDRVRPIQAEHSGVYGRETAYEVHESLRRLGGVRPPQEFVFMDRAAVGVGSVFMHLRAELNWYEEFQKLIADFSADQLQNRQNQVLASVGL
ncbi:MAG: AarF/ABC1/UbiB kinase family protein, partial [Holosporales bacterium]